MEKITFDEKVYLVIPLKLISYTENHIKNASERLDKLFLFKKKIEEKYENARFLYEGYVGNFPSTFFFDERFGDKYVFDGKNIIINLDGGIEDKNLSDPIKNIPDKDMSESNKFDKNRVAYVRFLPKDVNKKIEFTDGKYSSILFPCYCPK